MSLAQRRCGCPLADSSAAVAPRAPFRRLALLFLVLLASGGCVRSGQDGDAAVTALTAVELGRRIASGELTAERVARAYLERIEALDDAGPELHAVIEINPDALAIAASLDASYAAAGPVGPLHGVPVLLKANIDTADRMATSAGSALLAEHHPTEDAELVVRLRAAGAVVLGKTNLSEWANFRSLRSVSGWSSAGGQTKNPYVLDRNPCGSSSGSAVAVAARLAPLAVGTETDGSIVCPAGTNGVVGIKPTLGRVSVRGIVPIAHSQDVAGPLARTVADAALLFDAIAGEPLDARAAREDLRGVRIGVVRDYAGAGTSDAVEAAFASALAVLTAAGAELADPVRLDLPEDVGAAELERLLHEFKTDVDAYLARRAAPPRSLAEAIELNEARAASVLRYFGQELFIEAQRTGGVESPTYAAAVASTERARSRLAALFAVGSLDVLVAPTNGPAWRTDYAAGDRYSIGSARAAAVSGYPSLTVPAALADGLPIGVSLVGKPNEEAALVAIAAVYERARGPFAEPGFAAGTP